MMLSLVIHRVLTLLDTSHFPHRKLRMIYMIAMAYPKDQQMLFLFIKFVTLILSDFTNVTSVRTILRARGFYIIILSLFGYIWK